MLAIENPYTNLSAPDIDWGIVSEGMRMVRVYMEVLPIVSIEVQSLLASVLVTRTKRMFVAIARQ